MKNLMHYPKVLTLGSAYTENALDDEVIIQEKVDGSQFRFGVNEDGVLLAGSHNENWGEELICPDMFKKAVDYLKILRVGSFTGLRDIYFFCEYLSKPKHNVLKYDRIPKNTLVLFDALFEGRWISYDALKEWAKVLDIDVASELWKGDIRSIPGENPLDFFKKLHQTISFLGGAYIEGVVIKNYHQTIFLGGQVWPLFTKYVREEYKEQHKREFKTDRMTMNDYIKSFANENRWQKAVIHLQEKGELTKSVKDIENLIHEIKHDIHEEDKEDIKNHLFGFFLRDIMSSATRGFAEWYKEKLIKDMELGAPK